MPFRCRRRVTRARTAGWGVSARMRALTPLACELGVSGSGVGESGSVGRVSPRLQPKTKNQYPD